MTLKFDPQQAQRSFHSDAYRQELGWGPGEIQRSLDEADGFDREFGTDTSAVDFATPPGTYVPIIPRMFRDMMSGIRLPFEDFVFVDIGSGKGRALLLASDYPFKRCSGLELSPIHHARAEQNIALYRGPAQRCRTVESLCQDATTYDFPKEDLFLHFFHSFGLEPFTAMVS